MPKKLPKKPPHCTPGWLRSQFRNFSWFKIQQLDYWLGPGVWNVSNQQLHWLLVHFQVPLKVLALSFKPPDQCTQCTCSHMNLLRCSDLHLRSFLRSTCLQRWHNRNSPLIKHFRCWCPPLEYLPSGTDFHNVFCSRGRSSFDQGWI